MTQNLRVNQECVGCGQCAAYCPFDAIIVFGRAIMNEKCTGCGKCVRYCPIRAISETGSSNHILKNKSSISIEPLGGS